jgi:hypothetical protein
MKKKTALPPMLERVQRCQYCNREMPVGALAYAENPFCEKCLPERIKAAEIPNARSRWVRRGRFMRLI